VLLVKEVAEVGDGVPEFVGVYETAEVEDAVARVEEPDDSDFDEDVLLASVLDDVLFVVSFDVEGGVEVDLEVEVPAVGVVDDAAAVEPVPVAELENPPRTLVAAEAMLEIGLSATLLASRWRSNESNQLA